MPRPLCGVELSARSGAVDLPPITPPLEGARQVQLVEGEAAQDTWRIVEVFGRAALPFDVHLAWASGGGAGAEARLTVSRSARVCVYARSLRVMAESLSDQTNRAGVTVADGYAVTRNQWEQRGVVRESLPLALRIPPFAERLRVDVAELAALPTTLLSLRDGLGVVRAVIPLLLQPPGGVPVGGAATAEVSSNADFDARAVFHLSL